MPNPTIIENPAKIGVGTYPIAGLGAMSNGIAQLGAKWFYTWADRLPILDIVGWSLGAGVASGGDGGDRTLRLSSDDGWAVQSFSLTGGADLSLSFSVNIDSNTFGGVFIEYVNVTGKSVGSLFAPINDDGFYSIGSAVTESAVTARLILYTNNGIAELDDISVRVRGVEAVVNGGFESVALGSESQAGFVPMIWGDEGVMPTDIAISGPGLLTFNEPDNPDQADMSVAEALAAWPKLMESGARLGSPATTMENTLGEGSWLRRFMGGVDAAGYRVDFMAVHYYPRDGDVEAFRAFLQDVHDTYKRPIWVTEWALADWTDPGRFTAEEQRAFFEAATQMMDDLPFVERHAWFATHEGLDDWRLNSALIGDDGALTALGERFAVLTDAQGGPATAPPPTSTLAPFWTYGTSAQDEFVGGAGDDIFAFGLFGTGQRDRVSEFGREDILATAVALKDSNRDGIITFGKNGVLDLSRDGKDTILIDGIDPARGLRALGERDGLFFYADATVRPKSVSGRIVIEGTVGDDALRASKGTAAFFFDTASGIGTGHDRVFDFTDKSLLVTTSPIGEAARDTLIASQGESLFEIPFSASSLRLFDELGSSVEILKFDGSLTANGVTYFVYSAAGSVVGLPDLLGS